MSLTLVADVGGTNTRLALADGVAVREDTIRRYRNDDLSGLEDGIARFLSECGQPAIAAAAVDIAGPVADGRGELTNLPWAISEEGIRRATGSARALLLNDLQAQGFALGHLPPGRQVVLFPGSAGGEPGRGRQLVVNVGTGFNAVAVHDTAFGRIVPPSECGHVTLPEIDADATRLADHLRAAHGFASVEEAISGRGVRQVYGWLAAEAGQPGVQSSADVLDGAAADPHGLAAKALRMVVRLLGAVTGDLALVHVPVGGIWLVGGMARALAPALSANGFAEAYGDKGRFGDFVRRFPVGVVEDDNAALTGCAAALGSAPP